MSEIKVQYTEVDMVCDTCGDGRMRPIGTVVKGEPTKYIHECDNCCEKAVYEVRYPYRVHEERIYE